MKKINRKEKGTVLSTAVLCVVGVVLNYIFAQLVLMLKLPLYLDNVGSVLVAVLSGPLTGMTVGFISNLVNSINDPITMYYGILTVFIAFTAWLFSRKGKLCQIRYVLAMTGFFVLIGGAGGSCMTWMLYGGGIGEGISAPYALAFSAAGLSDFWAQLMADVLIDIPDKLITSFMVYAFLKNYPKKLYNKFYYSYLYDRSAVERNKAIQIKKRHYRKHSVNTIIMLLTVAGLVGISFCSTVVGSVLMVNDQLSEQKKTADDVARAATTLFDVENWDEMISQNENSQLYREQRAALKTLAGSKLERKHICIYQVEGEDFKVLFDSDSYKTDLPGKTVPMTDEFRNYIEKLNLGQEIGPTIVGKSVTACAPIADTRGNTLAYVFVDWSLNYVMQKLLSYIIRMIAIQFALSILIVAYTAWFARERIIVPINRIVEQSNAFENTDAENWLESSNWTERKDVTTGDEIEELYKTICRVEENVAINITQLKRSEALERANAELSTAIEKVKDADSAKSTFLSRMSHDIRTPLNVIIGMCNLAQDNDNPSDTQECLRKIGISGEFLLGLVNDVLDIERIESGKIEVYLVPYSGEEFRSYINTIIKPLCDNKGISFVFDIDGDGDYPIMIDKLHFNQVVFNLLSNAVKFTLEGGQIELRVQHRRIDENHAGIYIKIADNGIGMSEEFQKHMFESFTQENQVMKTVSHGSGLGLSIVKKMCELMKADISVASKLGKGTTYVIKMQCEISEQVAEVKTDEVVVDLSILKDKAVLVCEDHLLNQEIITRILKKKGVVPVVAENGQKALDIFTKSAPKEYAAILMDVRMPIMDGIEATKRIRSLSRSDATTIPIIAMTANAYEEDVRKTKEAGMNEHLSKPIDADKIYETLAIYIKNRR